MKTILTAIIIASLIFASCDDNCPSCLTEYDPNEMDMPMDTISMDTMSMDSCAGFKTVSVAFYIDIPLSYRVIPATFETFTEQVLVSEAGTTESLYEEVTEQRLKKDAYSNIVVMSNLDSLSIVYDLKNTTTQNIPCIDSTYTTSFDIVEVPDLYTSEPIQKLVEYIPGGDTIVVQYTNRTYQRLTTDASVEELNDISDTTIVNFLLPDSVDIIEYLDNLAMEGGFPACLSEAHYEVL